MGVLLFRGEAPVVCLAQPNGLGSEKDCHSGATPRPFAAGQSCKWSGRCPLDCASLLPSPPGWARQTGGALPLKSVKPPVLTVLTSRFVEVRSSAGEPFNPNFVH
jgi:hypothetical protein